MTRDELLKVHEEMCGQARAIMRRKNHDYAGSRGDEPFANFTRSEAMGICTTEQGFLVRFTDKLSRLSTFASAGKLLVADEGVEDTCLDIINYAILLSAYLRSKKQAESDKDAPHVSV
jgi:hypothetical protein